MKYGAHPKDPPAGILDRLVGRAEGSRRPERSNTGYCHGPTDTVGEFQPLKVESSLLTITTSPARRACQGARGGDTATKN